MNRRLVVLPALGLVGVLALGVELSAVTLDQSGSSRITFAECVWASAYSLPVSRSAILWYGEG